MHRGRNHPMAELVLRAFEDVPAHDAVTLAVYLSDASGTSVSDGLTNLMRHYRIVAEDVLGCLHEQGAVTRDAMGWYRRTGV